MGKKVSTRISENTSDLPWLAPCNTELLVCRCDVSCRDHDTTATDLRPPRAWSVGGSFVCGRVATASWVIRFRKSGPFSFRASPLDWQLLPFFCLSSHQPSSCRLVSSGPAQPRSGAPSRTARWSHQPSGPPNPSCSISKPLCLPCKCHQDSIPGAQGREFPTSHWRDWEASPLRRRRKETWVCFLGSENKPEWRERVNTRLSKAFKTKPVQWDLHRHRELSADFWGL